MEWKRVVQLRKIAQSRWERVRQVRQIAETADEKYKQAAREYVEEINMKRPSADIAGYCGPGTCTGA